MEPLDKKYERKRISTLCLSTLLMLIMSVLASVYFVLLVPLFVPAVQNSLEAASWLSSAGQYLVAFPLCAIMMSLVLRDPMEKQRLGFVRFWKIFLICCFMMMLGSFLGIGANYGIGKLLGRTPENILNLAMEQSSRLYNIVVAVILAPLFEEWVFRKMLIDRVNRLGDRAAMFLSALLFGLVHGNLYQFFYTFLVGLVFAYVYLRTGRIRYSLVMHMLINLLFGVGTTEIAALNNTILIGVWGGIELILAIAGLVMLIREWKNRKLLRGWVQLPKNRWASLAFLNIGMLLLLVGSGALFAYHIIAIG